MTDRYISVFKPTIPSSELLLPYLQRIDQGRWYTNRGPLLVEFESALAIHFGCAADNVACTASGTLGLAAGLMALGARRGSYCVMPSWTFAATPAAACLAGLVPYFVDIDERDWVIGPDAVRDLIGLAEIGAVTPVSPFGAPLDRAVWDAFTQATEIPVLIDAAASFDSVAECPLNHPGPTPMMISLHATKVFGVGEGGVLLCTDVDFVKRVRQIINHGFRGAREAGVLGMNGKLNEYAAAVGLAGLEVWEDYRNSWRALTDFYRSRLDAMAGVSPSPGFGAGWVSSYGNVVLPPGMVMTAVMDRLRRVGIDTRQWWTEGCHRQPAFLDFPRAALPVTEALASRVLGLPFWLDLEPGMAERVLAELVAAIEA